jgi:hypothetical protein
LESWTGDESAAMLAQLPVATLGGRLLSNLELTNGCVPLFGADDPPLPTETDQGIYETKEEQVRSTQQRRSQVTIDKFVSPQLSIWTTTIAGIPELPRLLDAVAKRVSANRYGSAPPQQGSAVTSREVREAGVNPPISSPREPGI